MKFGQSKVVNVSSTVDGIVESCEDKSVPIDMKTSKWAIVKASNRRIAPRASQGEIKLRNLIDELKKITNEDHKEVHQDEHISMTNFWNCMRLFRRHLVVFLQKPVYHYIIIVLVIIDLIVVLIDLTIAQLSSPCLTEEEMEQYNTTEQRETCLLEHSIHLVHIDLFLYYFSVLLLSLFVLEVLLSFYAFGWKHCKNPFYFLDPIIVFASFILEIYFHYGNIGRAGRATSALILLRLWKIIRATHAVAHSIALKNRALIEKIQEAKILLEEEKNQAEQTLEKQEIKVEYLVNLLTRLGKLPSTKQIDNYVNNISTQKQKQT